MSSSPSSSLLFISSHFPGLFGITPSETLHFRRAHTERKRERRRQRRREENRAKRKHGAAGPIREKRRRNGRGPGRVPKVSSLPSLSFPSKLAPRPTSDFSNGSLTLGFRRGSQGHSRRPREAGGGLEGPRGRQGASRGRHERPAGAPSSVQLGREAQESRHGSQINGRPARERDGAEVSRPPDPVPAVPSAAPLAAQRTD